MFRNDINNYLSLAKNTASDPVAALAFLEKALENTEAKISCLGGRYVSSSTNNGFSSIDRAAYTANRVFGEFRKTWDFDTATRQRIKNIEDKIDSFYTNSSKELKKSNWLIKVLNFMREFNLLPYTTRFFWEENTRISSHYRADQWSIFWGKKPNPTLCSRQPDVYYHA